MRTVALATITSMVVALVSNSPADAEIPWQSNLRTAHAKAEAEGKLLLLHFYSDNCVYCDRLEAGAFQAPQVGQAIVQNFVPVKIHANSAPELTKMFNVTKFPTDVVVNTDGTKLVHQVSPQDPTKYVAMLTETVPSFDSKTEAIAVATPQPLAAPAAPEAGLTLPPSTPATSVSATTTSKTDSKLAGYRDDRTSFDMPDMPDMPTQTQASSPSPVATTPGEPELAMEGFCAVTVINEDKWVEGKPEHAVVHLGKLYLFQNEQAMNTFLADPVPYTPILNEIDVVRFFEERTIVQGKREWGVKDPSYQRMFFFADEAAMNHFIEEHHRYTDAAIDVMEKAVKDANPES